MQKKLFCILFLSISLSTPLWAAKKITATPNAICVYEDNPQLQPQSRWLTKLNNQKKYELASVSKIFTAYWALTKLGPNFRFKTKIHINKLSDGKFNVHIEGDRDPYFGRNMTYILMSELNKLGVREVENLSFDENFKSNWNVSYYPGYSYIRRSYLPTPDQVQSELLAIFNFKKPNQNLYELLKNYLIEKNIFSMTDNPALVAKNVFYLPKRDYLSEEHFQSQVFIIQSLPLIDYIKEMMGWSHNYVADLLFMSLGNESFDGITTDRAKANSAKIFKNYISEKMNIPTSDFEFFNGSGDSEFLRQGKVYNKANCEAVLKSIRALKSFITQYNLDLTNIFPVSGNDRGTLLRRYSDMKNHFIGKSGTVDLAVTLAGVAKTNKSDIIFSILYETKNPEDWNNARDFLKKDLQEIIDKNNGANPYNYEAAEQMENDFVSFDNTVWAPEKSVYNLH